MAKPSNRWEEHAAGLKRWVILGQADVLLVYFSVRQIGRYMTYDLVYRTIIECQTKLPCRCPQPMRSASWAVTLRSRGAGATSPRVTWPNAQDLSCLLGAGSPLGGARPKSAVGLADERLAIAKFPKPDDTRDIAAGETLALTQTKGFTACGLRQIGSALDPGMSSGLPKEEDRSNQRPFPWRPVLRIWWQSASAGIRRCSTRFSNRSGFPRRP